MRKGSVAKNVSETENDSLSTNFIGLTFLIILSLSVIINLTQFGTFENSNIAWLGLIIMVTSLVIRIYAMATSWPMAVFRSFKMTIGD